MKNYELITSTSEHKICVYGRNLQELFTHALLGMIASCEPVKVINSQNYEAEFSCIGFDYESLLINFLSEALYLSAVNKVVYERVVFTNFSLEKASGVLGGYAISKFNNSEIKAVTHHGVNIQRVNNILQTTILFDV